ncbi:MAG: hypothetical protein NTY66_02000 [Candidatus Vogelbacteria bacterium]|nr:hypothetical protein [Candidatus Vogelbacteria bacterium]
MFRTIILLLLLTLPLAGLAATSTIIPCGGSGAAGGISATPCTWNDLYILINNVIRFVAFDLGIPLMTLAIIVGGLELVWHRDEPTARKIWKDRILQAFIGLALILCAYLLVKVVVWGLTGDAPAVPNSDFYNLRSRVNQ